MSTDRGMIIWLLIALAAAMSVVLIQDRRIDRLRTSRDWAVDEWDACVRERHR